MKDGLVIMNLDICGGSTIVDYNELYPATAYGLNPLSGATKNSFLTVTNASHTNLKTSDIFSSSKNCSIYLKYKPRITGISGQYIFSQFAVNKPVVKVYNYQTTVTAGSSFQIAIFKMGVGTISYTITGISSQDLNGALLTGNLTTAYTILSYKANVNATIQFSIPSADVLITSATGKNQKAIVNFPLLTLDGAIPFTNYTVMTYTKPANDYIRIDISANGTSSPITVTGLTNLTPYYFTVTASNTTGDIGNRSMITSIPTIPDTTVPDAPSFGSITGGNAKAIVGFTTPDNGGLTITGYTINTYTLSGSTYSFVKTQIGTSSPITVTGLTNLTSYYFDVFASNAKGNGLVSTKTTTPLIPDATAPDTAPTITTMVAGNAKATVSYTAPTSNGGAPITSYTVNAYTKAGSVYTNVKSATLTTATPATPSPIDVTGLTIGTPHYFNIYASNIKGMGIASDISSTAVTPFGPPSQITVINYSNNTVTFTAPYNGGYPISSYTYTVNCPSPNPYITNNYQGFKINDTQTTSGTTITFTNLLAGNTYNFTIYATNIAGNSPSKTITFTTNAATAPTITNLQYVSYTSNRNATFSYTISSFGGLPLENPSVASYSGNQFGGALYNTNYTKSFLLNYGSFDRMLDTERNSLLNVSSTPQTISYTNGNSYPTIILHVFVRVSQINNITTGYSTNVIAFTTAANRSYSLT
jgi:hypothetical protein